MPNASAKTRAREEPSMSTRPDRVILVFNADSGLRAMLLDVLKKAVGREDCTLCEITYGPLGKRSGWKECERSLGLAVEELHRDELGPDWGITAEQLPCVLGRTGDAKPFLLVTRDEIAACGGSIERLEQAIRGALDRASERAA